MPADLTREEIAHWRDFIVNLDPPDDVDVLLRIMDAARRSLDEPTRLAQARADGVRDGVEAVATALRREIPTGEGSTRSLTWSEALDAVDAIRALTTPPAGPAQPDDGWIEWDGGGCPVAHGPIVGLRFRDGREAETLLFRTYRWRHNGDADDIIAYRIVKPASAPVAGGE